MTAPIRLIGALLAVPPLISQQLPGRDPEVRKGEVVWFLLTETKQQITSALGQPAMIAEFGADFRSWQYQIDNTDHDEFSHQLVFRRSTGALISVTRSYDPERNVDSIFPPAETSVHHYPNASRPEFSVRLRRLSGGRVLMAMGASQPGQVTGQIVLMRESELRYFYPWIAQQLAESGK